MKTIPAYKTPVVSKLTIELDIIEINAIKSTILNQTCLHQSEVLDERFVLGKFLKEIIKHASN